MGNTLLSAGNTKIRHDLCPGGGYHLVGEPDL